VKGRNLYRKLFGTCFLATFRIRFSCNKSDLLCKQIRSESHTRLRSVRKLTEAVRVPVGCEKMQWTSLALLLALATDCSAAGTSRCGTRLFLSAPLRCAPALPAVCARAMRGGVQHPCCRTGALTGARKRAGMTGERQDGRRRRWQERQCGLGATHATLRATGSRLRCRLSLEARLKRTQPGVRLRQMRPSVGVREAYYRITCRFSSSLPPGVRLRPTHTHIHTLAGGRPTTGGGGADHAM
jgi:hypothetical protein